MRAATSRYVRPYLTNGSHKVVSNTHINVVPALDRTTLRQSALGWQARRQRTSSIQQPVAHRAITHADALKCARKPGTRRPRLRASGGGKPVCAASQTIQTKADSPVKLRIANQSIAFIAPRLSVGRPQAASMDKAGKSSRNSRFVWAVCRPISASSGIITDNGSAICGTRRRPGQQHQEHAARGEAGQANSGRFVRAEMSARAEKALKRSTPP